MKTCPKCGQPTSIWSRSLSSGLCSQCEQAEADQRAEEVKQEDELERAAAKQRAKMAKQEEDRERETVESIMIGDRKIACPICGHDRFSKEDILMNTRGTTWFNMEWTNPAAKACICKHCGYVLWFRN